MTPADKLLQRKLEAAVVPPYGGVAQIGVSESPAAVDRVGEAPVEQSFDSPRSFASGNVDKEDEGLVGKAPENRPERELPGIDKKGMSPCGLIKGGKEGLSSCVSMETHSEKSCDEGHSNGD